MLLFCLFNLSLFWNFRSRRHHGIVCVVPVVFSWTPYSWFQTRDKAELFVDKTIQFPSPPPPPPYQRRQPLNVFLSPNVAAWKTANYKASVKGKSKGPGCCVRIQNVETYLSIPKVSGTVHDGQQTRSWTPAKTNKQANNKTLSTNYWVPKGPNQRKRRRRTQWTNPKEWNDQMTQKLKRRLRQLCLAILDLHN